MKDQKMPLIMQGEGIERGVRVIQGEVGETSMEGKVVVFEQQMVVMISEKISSVWFII